MRCRGLDEAVSRVGRCLISCVGDFNFERDEWGLDDVVAKSLRQGKAHDSIPMQIYLECRNLQGC